jgi:hypothetical protein
MGSATNLIGTAGGLGSGAGSGAASGAGTLMADLVGGTFTSLGGTTGSFNNRDLVYLASKVLSPFRREFGQRLLRWYACQIVGCVSMLCNWLFLQIGTTYFAAPLLVLGIASSRFATLCLLVSHQEQIDEVSL